MSKKNGLTMLLAVMACLVALATCVYGSGCTSNLPKSENGLGSILIALPNEQAQIVQTRIDAKNRVGAQLLAGELTLLEAAAWFRYLNDNPQHYRCDFRIQWAGNSDGEKLCRQVMSWVEAQLRPGASESQIELIVQRLECELGEMLAQSETLELPW